MSLLPCSQLAAEYDSRFEKTVGRLEKEVRGLVDFIGASEGGRLLDYACGTGLLSRVRHPPASRAKFIHLSAVRRGVCLKVAC